jgi:hypothetical protein
MAIRDLSPSQLIQNSVLESGSGGNQGESLEAITDAFQDPQLLAARSAGLHMAA